MWDAGLVLGAKCGYNDGLAAMKVGLVSPYDFSHSGGVNNHVAHLAAELRRRGVETVVVAPLSDRGQAPEGVLALAGPVVTVPAGGSKPRVDVMPWVPFQVGRILRRQRFDVVHLHNPLTPLASMSFLWQRAAAPGTALVATFHEYRAGPDPLLDIVRRPGRRWLAGLRARIAVSEAARDYNQAYFPGEYAVIPNGIDAARFDPDGRRAAAGSDGGPVVLFVGRLEERKGLPTLLQAFREVQRQVPGARLVVAGDYDRRAAALPARPAGHVEFVGRVSDAALPDVYRAADVFCAPSVDFESFGIVLLEAMAAGVPIVASDIRGYREVLEDGRQGVLVPPRNPEALAAAIVALLGDPQRRQAMGRAGRETAVRYDWQRVAGQVLAVYEQAMAAERLSKNRQR